MKHAVAAEAAFSVGDFAVVIDDDDGGAALVDAAHRFEQPLHDDGCETEGEFVDCQQARPRQHHHGEREHLLNAVTTNKTDFFREPAHFDLLRTTIVPRLAAAGLFFVNVVAALSYWANLSASAIEFHFVWGVLIAIVATVGPGRLALQTLWQRKQTAAQGHAY